MKIVFFGSDDFAAVNLEHLLQSRHSIVGCVTQPDTRQGRGMQLTFSPIKILAAKHNIQCIQPETLKEANVVDQLKAFHADLFVVVAYGRILTKEVLALPKMFCINVHGSLLPKYRGAAPVNWAVLNGDAQTGVTVQKMALSLDAGDIIAQRVMDIPPEMSADMLRENMAVVGAKLLVNAVDQIEDGQYQLVAQDEKNVSWAPKLTKVMGKIDWHKSAAVIHNQIRGLKPWPGAFTSHQGKMLKIHHASVVDMKDKPGTVVGVNKEGFIVACAQEALLIKIVQPEAGKPMPAASYAAGHQIKQGVILG